MWAMVSRVKGSHILHWAPDYCLDLCVVMQCTGSILRGGKQLYTQHLYCMSVRWSLAFVNILSTSFFWSSHQTLLTRMLICSKRPHGLSREWASETDWEGETKRDRLTRWCHKTTFFFLPEKKIPLLLPLREDTFGALWKIHASQRCVPECHYGCRVLLKLNVLLGVKGKKWSPRCISSNVSKITQNPGDKF